jgi:hypothetical protein
MKFENKEIIDLLTDTFKKLESTANQDSKKLSDMNNALNWILTLTTVLFVFYNNQSFSNCVCFGLIISFLSKSFFVILIVILLVHKIALINYESSKSSFVENLRTHYIELKFNIDILKSKYDFSNRINVADFINGFRFGGLIPYPKYDDRPAAFAKFDRLMKMYGKILKITFWTGMIVFSLYFIELIVIMINKNGC